MKDDSKTKKQLVQELMELRSKNAVLEKSEEAKKYRSLVENVREVIYELDSQGVVLYISPAIRDLLGYDSAEIVGKNFIELGHKEDQGRLTKWFSELRKGVEKPSEYRIVNKSGELRWTRSSTRPIMEDGQFKGARGILIDVTDRNRMEEALRESEKKYRMVVDNMADVITIRDMNLRCTYVSPSIMRLRGYTVEEAMAQTLEQVMTPESMQIITKVFEEEMKLEAGGTADPDRSRVLELGEYRKDGPIVWIENHLSFMRDEAHKPMSIISLSRDITGRKRAEEALRESEKKYRELFDFLPIPVYEMDFEGTITSVNRAIYESFRGSEEDLKKGFKAWQLLSPDEVEKSARNIQRLLKGEQSGGAEYTLMRLDGSVFPAIVISRVIYRDGKPVGLRAAIVDITERKQAEKVLKETIESLRKAVSTTIQVMVSAVEIRDPYTAGHQIRSADLARSIASEMGLSQEKIDGIRMAGSIHDIGKLSIPAEILSKPGKLTDLEFSLIKEHSQSGYELLKDVESPWPLAEIVLQHHERMNGSGYPGNLKGSEILMEARIMAVADVVESMGTHRPYRPALGMEAALDEITKNRDILYDPEVVDACLRLFKENGYKLK